VVGWLSIRGFLDHVEMTHEKPPRNNQTASWPNPFGGAGAIEQLSTLVSNKIQRNRALPSTLSGPIDASSDQDLGRGE
jgi:hypothetical protein